MGVNTTKRIAELGPLIIEAYINGSSMQHICRTFKVGKRALRTFLVNNEVRIFNTGEQTARELNKDFEADYKRGFKTCSKCKESKPHGLYGVNKRSFDGYLSYCKSCHNNIIGTPQKRRNSVTSTRKWQNSNKDRVREYSLKYKTRKFELTLAKRYGITIQQYNLMLASQDYKCAICRRDNNRLDVDHDHQTSKVRGLLCVLCNQGIGMLKDDADLLYLARIYLACPPSSKILKCETYEDYII